MPKILTGHDATQEKSSLNLGCLDGLIGFHITMAQVAVYRDFCQTLEKIQITQKQFAVLEIIFNNPDVSQIDIAYALDTDRATMMALIERLQQRGFIDRRQSLHDRRRQELTLTSAGAEIRAASKELIQQHERALFSSFNPKESAALVKSLKRVYR